MGKLEEPVDLICMSLNCVKELKYPDETQVGTGRHADSAQKV